MSARRGEHSGEVTIATFCCAILDGQNMKANCEELIRLVEEQDCCKLVLDFHKVEHLSSEALGSLITLQNKLSAFGVRLVLCDLVSEVYEIFEITKLDRFFTIEDDPVAEQGGVEISLKLSEPTEQPSSAEPVILPFPSTKEPRR